MATDTPTKLFQLDTARPWMFRPFAIVGDEIWEGIKFVRINKRTQQETPMPALREESFQPGVFAQQVTPQELLLADPAGIWLIHLK